MVHHLFASRQIKSSNLNAKIAGQWHFETTGELPANTDVIFVENLQVTNMTRRCQPKPDEDGKFLANGQAAKSGLNKSFADAGIAGRSVVKGTSQHCGIGLNQLPQA